MTVNELFEKLAECRNDGQGNFQVVMEVPEADGEYYDLNLNHLVIADEDNQIILANEDWWSTDDSREDDK